MKTFWMFLVIMLITISANACQWQTYNPDNSDFYGSAFMQWAVDVGSITRNEYKVEDGRLQWNMTLEVSSVSGIPSTGLLVNIPEGLKPAKSGFVGTVTYTNGGAYGTGVIYVNAGDPRIWLMRNFNNGPNLNWRKSNVDTYIMFNLDMAVQ